MFGVYRGGNRYEVAGKMTIKGRTQDLSTPVTVTQRGSSATFEGSLVLKRADYDIGGGVWADFGTVANEVQIKFHLVATVAGQRLGQHRAIGRLAIEQDFARHIAAARRAARRQAG